MGFAKKVSSFFFSVNFLDYFYTYQKNEPGRDEVRGDEKGSPGGNHKEGGGQVHLGCRRVKWYDGVVGK